ncbi:uncharacterized protein METZ01_LOCUS271014 [marine metagenome]|uniref:Uncharacterized protein n=1 Tax=marine metagenome TaxID=408172 RepID=A0A382K128_9ZZZZ
MELYELQPMINGNEQTSGETEHLKKHMHLLNLNVF